MATTKPNVPESDVIHFDLDEALAELESSQKKREPFRFNFQGRVLTLTDPEDLDWRDAALLDDPLQMFNLCMSADDRNYLYQHDVKVPAKAFGKIVEAFMGYYNLNEKLAAAQRQARLENRS